MITNPFLGTPQEAGWAMGFAFGFSSPPQSVPPPGVIAPELVDAFNEGVLVGQQAAIEGFEFGAECIDTIEEHSFGSLVFHSATPVIEIGHGIWELRNLATVAAGIGGILVGLIELAVALPADVRTPEEVVPSLGVRLFEQLGKLGLGILEIFCGAGLDDQSTACQIKVSRVFKSFDQARDAALSMGRDAWLVVRWRTDTTDTFDIIDGTDP